MLLENRICRRFSWKVYTSIAWGVLFLVACAIPGPTKIVDTKVVTFESSLSPSGMFTPTPALSPTPRRSATPAWTRTSTRLITPTKTTLPPTETLALVATLSRIEARQAAGRLLEANGGCRLPAALLVGDHPGGDPLAGSEGDVDPIQ